MKGAPETGKTIQEIAAAAAVAYDLPPGEEPFLDDTTYYDPPNCTFPFGTHIAVVEVDAETGEVKLLRYVAVDDVGKVINPMIVDGQVHGGIAQGVAQALWESAEYDDQGQLTTSSLMDYAIPKAGWFPDVRARPDRDADRRQPARREGRGRDRHDRLDARGRERGRRRARAARDPAHRHAADAGARVARDRGGARLMYTTRPAAFEYHRPASVEEALSLLGATATSRSVRSRAGTACCR